MKNRYKKYFIEKEGEWHEYEIGIYHVSSIGNTHEGINPQEHYGPCLRATYWEYLDPEERDDESTGNFRMGEILHEIAQKIYKKNHPNSVIEFPIIYRLTTNILIKGSVDIIDFVKKAVIDLKSASLFTFPSSEYDYNPTYISQVKIYTAMLNYWIFQEEYFKPELLRIVYMKKHNLETVELDQDCDWDDIAESYTDFIERVIYLDKCLRELKEPIAEPHKWCKFCPILERCLEQKDIIAGKKKNTYIRA